MTENHVSQTVQPPPGLAQLAGLTTPHVADACLRAGVDYEVAPSGLVPVAPGMRVAGPARPVRHVGSVDVFLEACGVASPGDVLVVDNDGRDDEACIGDLTVLEAQAHGLAGMLVWGLHRDTADIVEIGWPVFSYGSLPTGPRRLDLRPDDVFESACFGWANVGLDTFVVADDDGAVFFPKTHLSSIVKAAGAIRDTERKQASDVRAGRTLRDQLELARFEAARDADPSYTFRAHLRSLGGSIEE